MAVMNRRVQILLDQDRYEILERESRRTGRPVAELIRDAVDSRFRADLPARRDAFARILAARPMPVDDWDTMKSELLDAYPDPSE